MIANLDFGINNAEGLQATQKCLGLGFACQGIQDRLWNKGITGFLREGDLRPGY